MLGLSWEQECNWDGRALPIKAQRSCAHRRSGSGTSLVRSAALDLMTEGFGAQAGNWCFRPPVCHKRSHYCGWMMQFSASHYKMNIGRAWHKKRCLSWGSVCATVVWPLSGFYKEKVSDINKSSIEMSKNSWSMLICSPLFLWMVTVQNIKQPKYPFFFFLLKLYTSLEGVWCFSKFLDQVSVFVAGWNLCGH